MILFTTNQSVQRFYEFDLEAMTRVEEGSYISQSFVSCLISSESVVGYFYTASSLLAFCRSLLLKQTALTGGLDHLTLLRLGSKSLSFFSVIQMFLFYVGAVSAKKLLCVSKTDMETMLLLLKFFPLIKKKVCLSHHSVSNAYSKAILPRLESCPDIDVVSPYDGITVCWMGSKENFYRKGVDRAIKLYDNLHYKGCLATLHIVGYPGLGNILLEQELRSCLRPDLFTYHGTVSDDSLSCLFLTIPFYLQLSRMEGFGLAVAEASLFGSRIICTDAGGLIHSRGCCYLEVSHSSLDQLDNGLRLNDPVGLFDSAPYSNFNTRAANAMSLDSERRSKAFAACFN